ncbi:MAG: 4-hydroxybenzoate octaprenyltransferase [Parvibaculales bacterium]
MSENAQPPAMAVSDSQNPYLWKLLPKWLRPYGELARWDRPIGTWLLLLPSLWGITLSAHNIGDTPDWRLMVLFTLGAFVMRGAGCCYNDILDRKMDAKVPRTQNRPLASGRLTVKHAATFLALQSLIGLLILLQLDMLAIYLGFASITLLLLYPLMKRLTHFPQFFLGFAMNWGVLLGWGCVDTRLSEVAWFLYIGGIFWTLGYDTIYAEQDKAADKKAGIKSTALFFGKHSRFYIALSYLISFVMMVAAGTICALGPFFYLAMLAVGAHFIWQVARFRPNDGAVCLSLFRSNRNLGVLVLGAILLGFIGR